MPGALANADHLREVERRRLKSLVDRDMAVAELLHGDDYQLVTPGGAALSKQEYLDAIRSGDLDYVTFEAASDVAVRVLGDGGILRYRASIETTAAGQHYEGTYWHTDFYEWRDERWQAVWSQATRIAP